MQSTVVAVLAALAVLGGRAGVANAETLATVGGVEITRAQVEEAASAQLVELEQQRYQAIKAALDDLVAEELLKQEAKARKVTEESLADEEVTKKVAEPTDPDVQQFYDQNKQRLGDQTLEQVKPRIVQYLKSQRVATRENDFIKELKGKHKTTVRLRPPVIEVSDAGRPSKGGGKGAPITIIEFSDYECPFCGRAEGVIDQVMKTYGDKIRLVFRDYPLPFHQNARPAAEAAHCANAQGKFWEYHGKLFANQTALGEEKLKAYAKEIGLDTAKFDKCLGDKTFASAVEEDFQAGAKVGVNGTPAFFINGRMLSGAQPFAKFKELIDEELEAAGQGS